MNFLGWLLAVSTSWMVVCPSNSGIHVQFYTIIKSPLFQMFIVISSAFNPWLEQWDYGTSIAVEYFPNIEVSNLTVCYIQAFQRVLKTGRCSCREKIIRNIIYELFIEVKRTFFFKTAWEIRILLKRKKRCPRSVWNERVSHGTTLPVFLAELITLKNDIPCSD